MIVELASSNDPWVPALLELARRTFPPTTLEPDERLLEELDGRTPGSYRYLAWVEDGLTGFIRFTRLSIGATLVVHLAVDPAHQKKGIGTALLQTIEDRPLLAEVKPGPAMDWWRRAGARVVTPTYVQPALRHDTEPYPLHLMALGNFEDAASLIEALYFEVWGLDLIHPFVECAVKGVAR